MKDIKINSTIISLLSGVTALTALVGTKLYPLLIPENTASPAVMFRRETSDIISTKDLRGRYTVNVEIFVVSNIYAQSVDIAEIIATALTNYSGTVNGINILDVQYDGTNEIITEDNNIYQIINLRFLIN